MYFDYLFDKESFISNKKFNALENEQIINNEKVLFIKPLSYMNLSGEVVSKYIKYYNINLDDVLIIQDDLDMPVGRYKLLFNRGDGGHNGIKNIITNVKSKEFLRLKIGISKNQDIDTKDYVLGKFDRKELKIIKESFDKLNDFINDYLTMNRDLLFGKYNSKE